MMPLRRSVCGLVLALLVAGPAWAQDPSLLRRVVLPGESVQAGNRLRALDRLIGPAASPRSAARCVGKLGMLLGPLEAPFALAPVVGEKAPDLWEEVEEAHYYLLNDSGESLVTLPPDHDGLITALPSVQVRRLCHLRLASLPACALALYRERVDLEAHRLLVLGRKDRDPAPLRQLVDEMFCSTWADQALDLLGDLAFERGDFEEARSWWQRLAPLPSDDAPAGDPATLRFPDPKVDLPRVQAKQVLALAFQGLLDQAQDELDRFHRRHPQAHGRLAGKDGPYSQAVQEAIHGVLRAGLANNADPWPTFAGSDARNQALTVCPPAHLWEDGPAWRVPLPPVDPPRKDKAGEAAADCGPLTRRAAFYPVVVGQQVLIAGPRSVLSYHLATGKLLFRYDFKAAGLADEPAGADRKPPWPRFTLTACGTRAYARFGRPALAPHKDGEADEPSFLVCLDIADPGDPSRPRELWRVQAPAEPGRVTFFEGTPLVRQGRAYVALSRLAGKRVVTALQCYDGEGRLRWSRDVCDCPEFEDHAVPPHRPHLLTWAGGQLVYCSHAGAVVAVEPWTGKALWAVRYPSRGPLTADGEPSPRDLAPCLYADGRVHVAPLDSDRLFCLEVSTGRVLWEREGAEVVHLLGAARGRLFFTTRQGLQAVDAVTGLPAWQQPSEGKLPGLGRGLLAGGWVLWPTQDAKLPLRAVTLAEGDQRAESPGLYAEPAYFDPTQLRGIPAGNFAFGHGCLVVAGVDELVAFVPPERLPPLPAGPGNRPHI
jgi:outer membrane protein assembly factor BamB